MSKTTKQYYIILAQRQLLSKVNGEKIIEITLVGVEDRELYHTYIDPRNRNYRNWSYVIHNPSQGYLLGPLKIKDSMKNLINADSKVSILVSTEDHEELYTEVLSKWHKQDQTGNFDSLFD
jgi:hypothetical protein